MHPEHARHAGAIEIHVQHADLVSEAGQRQSQVHGGHALPHAALPAHDHELVLDAGHALLDLPCLLRDLLDDFRVVGVLELAQDRFQIFLGHIS